MATTENLKKEQELMELERLREAVAVYDKERALLQKIAASQSLEGVFGEIIYYLRERWGFDSFGVQLVDHKDRLIRYFRSYGMDETEENCEKRVFNFDFKAKENEADSYALSKISVDVSLDGDSISAVVARSRKPFYADISKISKKVFEQIPQEDRDALTSVGILENLVIPLVDENGETIAVIHLISKKNKLALSKSKISEIQKFAQSIVGHIKREIEKFELERTKFEQQRIIEQVKLIGSHIELEGLLNIMGKEIEGADHFDGYLINLIDESKENLVCEKIKLPEEFAEIESSFYKMNYPLKTKDVTIDAFNSCITLYFDSDSILKYSGSTRNRFERWKMQYLAIIPIIREAEPLGTILVFKQEDELNKENVESIEKLASLFYDQIKNSIFYSRLKEKEELINTASARNKRMLEVINHINNITSTSEIYKMILAELLEVFHFDLGSILLHQNEKLETVECTVINSEFKDINDEFSKWTQQNPYEIEITQGSTALAYINNIHFYFPHVDKIMDLPMAQRDRTILEMLEPKSLMIMPIRLADKPVGVIWLYSLDQSVECSQQDIELIEMLSSFAGTAIRNAELYTKVDEQKNKIEVLIESLEEQNKKLDEMARKDKLTGLFNFAHFQEEMARLLNEYQRFKGKESMSLVIVDVDHFKKFNDTYGHIGGNIALQDIAGRIKQAARRMDIVCRYGGEEFIVILPKCDLQGAVNFAERLRNDVAVKPVKTDAVDVPVTISLGCSVYTPNEKMTQFIERADQALYRAKENGRNRVEYDGELPSQ
ncbi:MAG: sensor domain-containing diguanylate cyclase [Gammaproteobacteria bacterium]|nr:MAG: sensor domain-containing diguanylate cyclase [Gammaproteobacteria bacterium]